MDETPWMLRAIELARRGFPAPNPRVGCVLVKDGQVVGEGFHAVCGGPHAEAVALSQAGRAAQGATAFVTLEPCAHHGRTPPCSDALISAGVKRVVFALSDPNPEAAGGAQRFAEASIEIESGLCERQAAEMNWRWLASQRSRRPTVTLKAAITSDGFLARSDGTSKWITGEAARSRARSLRAECGAVLVGRGTVQSDDPQLTARTEGAEREPTRIVLDPKGTLVSPLQLECFPERLIHVTAGGVRSRIAGATHWQVPLSNGTLDLISLLDRLFEIGETGLLVEGGARTIGELYWRGLFDEVVLFVARKHFVQGQKWLPEPPPGVHWATGVGLELHHSETIGEDHMLVFRPCSSSELR